MGEESNVIRFPIERRLTADDQVFNPCQVIVPNAAANIDEAAILSLITLLYSAAGSSASG